MNELDDLIYTIKQFAENYNTTKIPDFSDVFDKIAKYRDILLSPQTIQRTNTEMFRHVISAINDFGLLSFQLGNSCRKSFLGFNKKIDARVKQRYQALHNLTVLIQQYAEHYHNEKQGI